MAGLKGGFLVGGSKGRGPERAGPAAERPRAGPAPAPGLAAVGEGAGRGPSAPNSGPPQPERPVASPPRAAAPRGAPPSPPAPAADAAAPTGNPAPLAEAVPRPEIPRVPDTAPPSPSRPASAPSRPAPVGPPRMNTAASPPATAEPHAAAPAGPSGPPRPVTILPAPTREEYELLKVNLTAVFSLKDSERKESAFEQLCGHRGLAAARCWRRYVELRGAAGPTPDAAALLPLVLDALEPSELLQGGTQHARNLARALLPELVLDGAELGRQLAYCRSRDALELRESDPLKLEAAWKVGHKLAGAYLAQAVVCAGVPGMAAVRADALDRAACVLSVFRRLDSSGDALLHRINFEKGRDCIARARDYATAEPLLRRAVDSMLEASQLRQKVADINREEAEAEAGHDDDAAAEARADVSDPCAGAVRAHGPFVANGAAWAPDEFQSWTSDAADLIGVDLVVLWQARELLRRCYKAGGRGEAARMLARANAGLGAHLRRQARALLAAAPPEAALAPLRGDAILIASRVQAELLSELTIAGEARAEPAARAAAADGEGDIDPSNDEVQGEIDFLNSSGPLACKALDHVKESFQQHDKGHERLAVEAIERAQLAAAGCSPRVQASIAHIMKCLGLPDPRLGEAASLPLPGRGAQSAQPARVGAGMAAGVDSVSILGSDKDANSGEGSTMTRLLAGVESVGPEGQRAAKLIRAADALIGNQRWEEARRMVAAVKQAAADGPLLIRESVAFFARELARILEKCGRAASAGASAGAGAESSGRPGYTLDEAIDIIQGSGPAGREALAQLDAAERLLKQGFVEDAVEAIKRANQAAESGPALVGRMVSGLSSNIIRQYGESAPRPGAMDTGTIKTRVMSHLAVVERCLGQAAADHAGAAATMQLSGNEVGSRRAFEAARCSAEAAAAPAAAEGLAALTALSKFMQNLRIRKSDD